MKSASAPKILAAHPATKAARYIQIENKIRPGHWTSFAFQSRSRAGTGIRIGLPRLMVAFAFACAGHACAGAALLPPAAKTEPPSIGAEAPTIEELKNTTYAGLDDRLGAVTLANGRWTGAPLAPDAASRPIVEIADGFRVVGDLDGDRQDEAVVMLTYRPGGTATLSFLAVVTRKDGTLRNVATTAFGDRVQLRPASMARAFSLAR